MPLVNPSDSQGLKICHIFLKCHLLSHYQMLIWLNSMHPLHFVVHSSTRTLEWTLIKSLQRIVLF